MLDAATAMASVKAIQAGLAVVSALQLTGSYWPRHAHIEDGSAFDYIIVGGGTSGSVLGNRLSADPTVSVLVIEAGGNYEMEVVNPYLLFLTKSKAFNWNYKHDYNKDYAKCHRDTVVNPTIAKVLGGGSSLDYMFHSQGFDRDYNSWAKIGKEPSWRFENVQRLFKKLEKHTDKDIKNSPDGVYHGFKGNLLLTKDRSKVNENFFLALSQIGRKIISDFNNRTRTGYSGATYYIHGGKRYNSALAYLYPVRNRTNLIVLKETQVTKIMINEFGTARGVMAVSKDNRTFVIYAKKEVIVSAGNYNTAKLLQLSGIGPKKLLRSLNIPVVADLPVGVDFESRVATIVVFGVEQVCSEFTTTTGNTKRFPSATFEGYVALNESQSYPDYRTITFPEKYSPAYLLLDYTVAIYRLSNSIVNCLYERLKGREEIFTLVQNLKQESRGVVRIRSANPFDPPFIDAKYYSNRKDVENMVKYVKDFVKILNSDFFRKEGAMMIDPARGACHEFEEYSDEYWECYVRCMMAPLSHNSGAAAMGRVVDGRLRVFGVKNLRVVDASIMPYLIPGSPTVPTIMIGENAAEMIIQDNMETD